MTTTTMTNQELFNHRDMLVGAFNCAMHCHNDGDKALDVFGGLESVWQKVDRRYYALRAQDDLERKGIDLSSMGIGELWMLDGALRRGLQQARQDNDPLAENILVSQRVLLHRERCGRNYSLPTPTP